MDNRGLVRAAPEGALTPDGVRVFAGQPQLVPGTRPTAQVSCLMPGIRACGTAMPRPMPVLSVASRARI